MGGGASGCMLGPAGTGLESSWPEPSTLDGPQGAEPKPPGREQSLIKLTRDCLVNICLPPRPPGVMEEKQLAVNNRRLGEAEAAPGKRSYCEAQSCGPED